MNNLIRVTIACILAITAVVGVVSVGVLATDAGDLQKEMEAAEDPVKFFNELSEEDQNALLEHIEKEIKLATTVEITQGGERSSTWVQITRTGWSGGFMVWRHILRVDWSYDGTRVWGVTNTDSYYGWGYGGLTWVPHHLYDYIYYLPYNDFALCWSTAHWTIEYYGIPVGSVYDSINITVKADGTWG